jgi:hypothetical protein
MTRPSSIICVRPDNFTIVCAWCDKENENNNKGKLGQLWAEERGQEVSHGICQHHKQIELEKWRRMTKEERLLEKLNNYNTVFKLQSCGVDTKIG